MENKADWILANHCYDIEEGIEWTLNQNVSISEC